MEMEQLTQQTRSDYRDLTEREQKEFIAKLIHAINDLPHAYLIAQSIVELASKYGVYKQVKWEKV